MESGFEDFEAGVVVIVDGSVVEGEWASGLSGCRPVRE